MIIGALGMVHKDIEGWMEKIGIKEDFTMPCTESLFAGDSKDLEICVEHLSSRDLTW